jgi:hypothetical protein
MNFHPVLQQPTADVPHARQLVDQERSSLCHAMPLLIGCAATARYVVPSHSRLCLVNPHAIECAQHAKLVILGPMNGFHAHQLAIVPV